MICLGAGGWGRCLPPAGTPLDASHALARGLIGCWLLHPGAPLFDHARRSDGVRQGANLVFDGSLFGPAGLRHASADSASYVQFSASQYDFDRTGPFSLEVVVWFTDGSTASGRNIVCGNLQSDGIVGTFLDLNQANANDVRFVLRSALNTSVIDVRTAGGVTATNAWNHLLLTYDGSSAASGVKLYVNGALVSTPAAFDNLSSSPRSGQPWCLGRAGLYTPVTPRAGTRYALHRIWNRALTAAEALWLCSAPYAMFQAEPPARIAILGLGGVLQGAGSLQCAADLSGGSVGIRPGAAALQGAGVITADGVLAGQSTLIVTASAASGDGAARQSLGDLAARVSTGDRASRGGGKA